MSVARGAIARPLRMAREHAIAALPIAVASTASYLLILWVFRNAPIAPAAALRDTSSIFALVIAVLWLKEPFTRLRLFAILLSAAAVPLLRLS
jgi:drug/metabolite transporter (DMT)-like permease